MCWCKNFTRRQAIEFDVALRLREDRIRWEHASGFGQADEAHFLGGPWDGVVIYDWYSRAEYFAATAGGFAEVTRRKPPPPSDGYAIYRRLDIPSARRVYYLAI